MFRTTAPKFAALAFLSAVAVPSLSASPPPVHFRAELAAPTQEARAIAGGVVFRCEGTTCVAPESGDRPVRVCRELRREVGTVASFTHGGAALTAEDIAACNS